MHMMVSLNSITHFFSNPSLSNTRYRFSPKKENFLVPDVLCGAKAQKWSIAEDHTAITSHNPSKVHQIQKLNVWCSFLDKLSMDYEGKVEHVRKLSRSTILEETDPIESLLFVDAVQRLGVNSYFQDDIQTILQQQYMAAKDHSHGLYSLHDVSLLFRLLRQHGYDISSDVFKNFKTKEGRFQGKIRQDIRGLMELYQAAQLSVVGEFILDEAANFSSQIIQEFVAADASKSWSTMVIANKLRHPYHKTIARMTEKYFLQDFGGHDIGWRKTLRELSVIDLHKRRSVYQEELLQISKWWNELGLADNLKFARNQPIKWYTWSMALLIDDMSFSLQRVEITKPVAFIYLIDDIFDLYGTPDELKIFTEAVNKWDYAAIDTLPDYMKLCYAALLDTTNEIAQKIYHMHGFNPIHYLKETWVNLCNAFLVEAKWLNSGELPRADVYLENGKVSSGVHVVLVHLFFLLGIGGVDGGQINLKDMSQITSNVAAILRLWDDLGSAKDEHQDGKDGSIIDCHMKDHTGASIGEARGHVMDMIENEWKLLNKECLRLNQKSAWCFKSAALNSARMVPLMYSYDDNHEQPVLEEYIKLMLFNETSQGIPRINQERFV